MVVLIGSAKLPARRNDSATIRPSSQLVTPDFWDWGYTGMIRPVLAVPSAWPVMPTRMSTTGLVILGRPLKASSLPKNSASVPTSN